MLTIYVHLATYTTPSPYVICTGVYLSWYSVGNVKAQHKYKKKNEDLKQSSMLTFVYEAIISRIVRTYTYVVVVLSERPP